MLQASNSKDVEIMRELDHMATTAEDRLDAAGAMLEIYDQISCGSDKARVKPLLKKQLAMLSWLFSEEAKRAAGALTFVEIPAAAQLGLSMKDALRAASEKLEAIEASLN